MANTGAVWGIDVGQCALKALKCRAHDASDRLIAEAFDYIEYPKILSQPGSDPAELVGDALTQFLSRNSVKGDRVAISVSGQAGLARFIKLPPVEAKKIPDIVRYEARQQIPFDLNDVIWDYQRMGGGSEEEGFALETEVGLFAMKRDAVARTLEPFQKAGIEIDFVQLTPLALYNFVLFDLLNDLPPPDQYDPESPPESIVVISLGTDATDLVVTNGYRVWQRSVPLGGNHFTKSLTKELKLTFAKAEHLKRNAASAQDPKAVFQAMRPVFSDMLTELQRSIGYFTTLDRAAKIGRVVALGNSIKLPGLRRYLSQNLGFEIERLEGYRGLVGPQVLTAPAFKDNLLCFGACYGLALQALGKAGLRTNLLPKEIFKNRLIRQKKPWAIAAAAVLLLACGISFASLSLALGRVDKEPWKDAESKATTVNNAANTFKSGAEQARAKFQNYDQIGTHLVGNVEGRVTWLEMLKVLNECMPRDSAEKRAESVGKGGELLVGNLAAMTDAEIIAMISKRNELHVDNLECQYVPDLAAWFGQVKKWYQPTETAAAPKPADPAAPPADNAGQPAPDASAAAGQEGPTGPGWVVQLNGHHFHNMRGPGLAVAAQYVRDTLLKNLQTGKVPLPSGDADNVELVSPKDLGFGFPVLIDPQDIDQVELVVPAPGGADSGGRGPASKEGPRKIRMERFDYRVQFAWKKVSSRERQEKQKQASEKKAEQ